MNNADDAFLDNDGRLTFEQRVAHFSAADSNAQSVVRFLDTKASAVIAAAPLVLFSLGGVFDWFATWEDIELLCRDQGYWSWIAWAAVGVPGVFAVFFAAWSLNEAFQTLLPRRPTENRPSTVFPYDNSKFDGVRKHDPETDFKARVALFTREPTVADAIECHQRQIVRMSEIVEQKLSHTQCAIRRLRWCVVFGFAFVAVLAVLASASFSIEGETISRTDVQSAEVQSHRSELNRDIASLQK